MMSPLMSQPALRRGASVEEAGEPEQRRPCGRAAGDDGLDDDLALFIRDDDQTAVTSQGWRRRQAPRVPMRHLHSLAR
eukprot:764142-Hanusia_phi.AAC.5